MTPSTMQAPPSRTFQDVEAVRTSVPLLIGLVGPSGTGKTFSALRLATGIQHVSGGDIYCIDTEARRMLHYADKFKFRHLDFGAPFSPLDYLGAIQHCIKKGARTIVIDSMSHEHEGPGGVLEWHEAEVERMSGGDWKKAERVNFGAWGKPKAARRRLINSLLQFKANFVFCFRSKEKLKPKKGGEPEPQGWVAIAGEEFVYEMTVKFALLPGANGIPSWESDFPGERALMKIPDQFRDLDFFKEPRQLDEASGEAMARWAAGSTPSNPAVPPLVAFYQECADEAAYTQLEADRKRLWGELAPDEKRALKAAADEARDRISRDAQRQAEIAEAGGQDI